MLQARLLSYKRNGIVATTYDIKLYIISIFPCSDTGSVIAFPQFYSVENY